MIPAFTNDKMESFSLLWKGRANGHNGPNFSKREVAKDAKQVLAQAKRWHFHASVC